MDSTGRAIAPAFFKEPIMLTLLASIPVLAAAGWSLVYLLLGGGLGGALLIFLVAKMLGR
jgi:hypothetical protein